MSVNNQTNPTTNLKEPSWPPEFSQYQDLSDANIVAILEKESENRKAPDAYKEFFSRLTQHYRIMVEKLENDEQTMQQLQTNCDKYSQYVRAARENYDSLTELYQEQHTSVLEMEEEKIQLGLEMESQRNEQEQATAELRQNLEALKTQKMALQVEFDRFKAEATRNAEKQGLGRRNLENILLEKERQMDELQRAANEYQSVIKQKTREVEDINAKYKAITTLLQGTRHLQQNSMDY